jgi:hypothetical protein
MPSPQHQHRANECQDWNRQNGQYVQMERRDDVTMEELMQRAEPTTTRALEASNLMEHAYRVKIRTSRVKEEED